MSERSRLDIATPRFDKYRNFIRQNKDQGKTWVQIRNIAEDRGGFKSFFQGMVDIAVFEEMISEDVWKSLVKSEQEGYENRLDMERKNFDARLLDSSEDNLSEIPKDPHSSWQLYKEKLRTSGFNENSILNIEKATIGILRRLSSDTSETGPIKGLAIGQVQSGKTANMAALMAMAADWGWDFFIILSGTIENLRKQTQRRIYQDLNTPGNLTWHGLEHVSPRSPIHQRVGSLSLDGNNKYFYVCLKNKSRLENLIDWMRQDQKFTERMKVLVIDDEADQASVNTANIHETEERKAINHLIVSLVEGTPRQEGRSPGKVKAMNYISYTATPYANFLNESTPESLYPKNFIWSLPKSNEYFGPKQIFGLEGTEESDGLNIVRAIESGDRISHIHDGAVSPLPESLKDAFVWFLCCVATMRYWKSKKPVSMLIHTSYRQVHHDKVAQALREWVDSEPVADILERANKIWLYETSRLTLDEFKNTLPNYGLNEQIKPYPDFQLLESTIESLAKEVTHIYLNEDDEFEYNDGLHLCIDNCSYGKVGEDGAHVRLAYPEKNDRLAPAFIVIGGSTLSRGLTIEGLVSTYFTRDSRLGDSLMQMGRWFGYRKGYELLPRIWLTDNLIEKFTFLASLEYDLQHDLFRFMKAGADPSMYGPRVKNTPRPSWLGITAKNKMQSAMEVDFDFTGASPQTTSFINDLDVLENNIEKTEAFLNELGEPKRSSLTRSALVWESIPFSMIEDNLLRKFEFSPSNRVFNDIDLFCNWVTMVSEDEGLTDWNVIVAGIGTANDLDNNKNPWILKHGSVEKVTRTRRIGSQNDPRRINIGVLGAPRDVFADIPMSEKELRNKTNAKALGRITEKNSQDIRSGVGLDKTPQLIIYRIDKDSKLRGSFKEKSTQRADLNAEADLIGMWIHIPGSKPGTSFAKALTISIQPENNDFDELEEVMEE